MSEGKRQLLLLAGLNVLWTPVNVAVRVATAHGMSPSAVALTRWFFVAVALQLLLRLPAFARYARYKPLTLGDRVRAMLIGALLFAPAHLLYYFGLTQGASTVGGTVLNATAPIWTGLLAFLVLSEKATPRRIAAIALGFIGAWVVVCGFGLPDFGRGNGTLLYLLGVICESFATVLGATIVRRSSGIGYLGWETCGMIPTLLVVPTLAHQAMPLHSGMPNPATGLAIAYMVLIPGLLCFGVWYASVERVPLSRMVVTILLQPPLAALLAWAYDREIPTANVLMGTVLIFAALGVVAGEKPGKAPT